MTVNTFDPSRPPRCRHPQKALSDQPGGAGKDLSRKIGFVSLGCPKNLVDSERILTNCVPKGIRWCQVTMMPIW
ncbi:Ribosomal protein S12 methylthiotransferase RimO [Dickeya solani]|nr:Ribosomal protein S12 methylthiotransferase RimO [Dickeya solani]